jgi:hypothetical protein
MPLLLCAAIGICPVSGVAAQTLYSVSSGPGFPIVAIDPNTGSVQTLQPTGAFSGVSSISAFDPFGRRLFFLIDAAGVQTLVVVNVQTGAVATHPIPLAGGSYAFLEYDTATRTLYSVASTPGFPLVTIDPNTGAVQTLQPTGSFTGVSSISAFDPFGRRLFFLVDASGVQTLVVVNVQTGTVATHPIPLAGGSYAFLEYDPTTRTLYSVGSTPGFPLVTIDPDTGAVQIVQPTGAFSGIFSSSALDPSGRRLFFLVDAAGVQTLVVVDLATGTVTTHAITVPGGIVVFLEFAGSLMNVPVMSSFGRILALLALGLAGHFLARQPR